MFDAKLDCAPYNIYKNDRQDREGGVLVAVKKQISINSINGIEPLFLKLSLSNNISFIVVYVYIPPSATINSYSEHNDLIESIALKCVES